MPTGSRSRIYIHAIIRMTPIMAEALTEDEALRSAIRVATALGRRLL
jgi:hypothetical protein